MEDVSPYRRPKENPPPLGLYDKHLIPFGADLKTKFSIGSKYIFKPNRNPPPGAYEVESCITSIKYRAPSAIIKEDLIS